MTTRQVSENLDIVGSYFSVSGISECSAAKFNSRNIFKVRAFYVLTANSTWPRAMIQENIGILAFSIDL